MIFSFPQVKVLKDEMQEKFGTHLHFHDRCGGQFFNLDDPTDEMKEYLNAWFAKKNCKLAWSADDTMFYVDDEVNAHNIATCPLNQK